MENPFLCVQMLLLTGLLLCVQGDIEHYSTLFSWPTKTKRQQRFSRSAPAAQCSQTKVNRAVFSNTHVVLSYQEGVCGITKSTDQHDALKQITGWCLCNSIVCRLFSHVDVCSTFNNKDSFQLLSQRKCAESPPSLSDRDITQTVSDFQGKAFSNNVSSAAPYDSRLQWMCYELHQHVAPIHTKLQKHSSTHFMLHPVNILPLCFTDLWPVTTPPFLSCLPPSFSLTYISPFLVSPCLRLTELSIYQRLNSLTRIISHS